MENPNLFDFPFVDRKSERKVIAKFLEYNKKKQVLWITGKHGVGKTFFIEKVFASNIQAEWTLLHLNFLDNMNDDLYLNEFINQLQVISKNKFFDFIKSNYKSAISLSKNLIKVALAVKDLTDFGITSLLASIAGGLIDKKDKPHSLPTVIADYIQAIIKKNKKIVIVFDNLTKYPPTLLNILETIIDKNIGNENIRFVVITTEEMLTNSPEHITFIAEKISNIRLDIKEFDENHFFIEMLSNAYEIDCNIRQDVEKIFDYCGGHPNKFKSILHRLYYDHGIEHIDRTKAIFVTEKLENLLLKESIDFDYQKLPYEQKLVLSIISIWSTPIPFKLLDDLFNYIFSHNNFTDSYLITITEIKQAIRELLNLDILTQKQFCQQSCIGFKQDMSNDKIFKIIHYEDKTKVFFYYSICFDFLNSLSEGSEEEYWKANRSYLNALFSYGANNESWPVINYNYACQLDERGNYYTALTIFERLHERIGELPKEWLLVLAGNLFSCGAYDRCETLLLYVNSNFIDLLTDYDKSQLYSMLAQVKSQKFDHVSSLNYIDKALESTQKDSSEQIRLLAQKQTILFLAPNKFHEAEDLFELLISSESDDPAMINVYQTAMDFCEGNYSLTLLRKGLKLAKHYIPHDVKVSKIIHNKGFEYIRCSDFEKARELTEEARKQFEGTSLHYQAYSYNNLATIEMKKEHWENAVNYLMSALIWNKSNYLRLVIDVNLFICFSALNDSRAEKYKADLIKTITEDNDLEDRIYKKILVNLAIVEQKNNNLDYAQEFIKLYKPRYENDVPSGKYRFINLYNQFFSDKLPTVNLPEDTFDYYSNMAFEPWIVTLTCS
ncbi:hypothetical protein ABID30_000606 [Enterococcus rotai]|uniref:ATPase domain-containing protein n=1 Tax=Enterococcus rotai TaxID=118060 RepID=A0A0U2VE12_9ENTE|nr:ATP-binding protein [Enterococcus rotai]ALS35932.1 hypothetical protein ATZ35_01800 [Enterococcus rotai]